MIPIQQMGVWACRIVRGGSPDPIYLVTLTKPGLQEQQQLTLLFAHMVAENLIGATATLEFFFEQASGLAPETLARFHIATITPLDTVEDITAACTDGALRTLGA